MPDKIELTKQDMERIETMAGLGLTVTQMSAILGISKKTFERRMNDNQDVNDAISKGRASASAKVLDSAFKMAVSGRHVAMTIFWLKCREHWKDTSVIEHTGEDGKPIRVRFKAKWGGTQEPTDE